MKKAINKFDYLNFYLKIRLQPINISSNLRNKSIFSEYCASNNPVKGTKNEKTLCHTVNLLINLLSFDYALCGLPSL